MSLKKSNNGFDSINNESIYHTELARKDKQILILRNRINNLVLNKNSLISQFDSSKQKNIPSLKTISPKNNLNIHNKLISSIQSLKYENSILRKKMNLTKKIEDKYSDTIKYKLLSAQKEIDNLTIMNTNKDSIIMSMQNFISNLNNIICNGKINLNLEQIDIKTFIKNLKQLEQKIVSKLQIKSKPNKIPKDIIKDAKQNSLIKQKAEISLLKKKNLFIIPLINRRNNKRTSPHLSANKTSNFSNNSLNIHNTICQNSSKRKNKDLKEMRCLTGRNKDKSTLELKRYFLTKQNIEISTSPIKEKMRSLDIDDYFKVTNTNTKTNNSNEVYKKRVLTDNGNGSFFKKISNK